ncbi:MAG: selenocysteine-specific translation elongation factor [Pseudomonadota bacterium]|nr:selenocysteine-specific translation elongation factor [Pseudomonadota bacterium]
MIYATAGHVDHGKTSLIRSLTDIDTDRLPEEKRRGLSIDLGFAYVDLGDGEKIGFVDVPGHERFVRTMVAGVGSVDAVLFVIALDDGPMPQTAEHLAILSLLGVSSGVVVFTKVDRVDEDRKLEVRSVVKDILLPTFLKESREFCVSTKTGEGIKDLKQFLLENKQTLRRKSSRGLFRLAVDRSFSLRGAGTVITGSIFSGCLEMNQTIRHLPSGGKFRIRNLHAQGGSSEEARVGQRCALNLSGSELGKTPIERGDWLVSEFLRGTSKRIHAQVFSLDGENLKHRMPVHFHLGAADVTGRLFFCDDQNTTGDSRSALLVFDKKIHAVKGDRFVLRDQAAVRTIGGGVVCDPSAEKSLSRARRCESIKIMSDPDLHAVFSKLLDDDVIGLDLVEFRQKCNVSTSILKEIVKKAGCVELKMGSSDFAVRKTRWENFKTDVLEKIKIFHETNPSFSGITLEELLKANFDFVKPVDRMFLIEAAAELIEQGKIRAEDGIYKMESFSVGVSPELKKMWPKIFPLLSASERKIPVVQDLSEVIGISKRALDSHMKEAVKVGYVIKISEKRFFLPETLAGLRKTCVALGDSRKDGRFSVVDFRDKTGIGRNAVVEILEFFDREGLTLRQGNHRVLRRR